MKTAFKVITIFLLLFSFSCGSKKNVPGKKKGSRQEQKQEERRAVVLQENRKDAPVPAGNSAGTRRYNDPISTYIAQYAPIAQEEMQLYKIPASITLAQGILESGAGAGELSLRANNHFGIKCHDWKGGKVYHDDDRRQECFRKYNDAKYSYRDHSLFLSTRTRYASLFELDPDDYIGWAKGLRAAGYATDRKYPEKLIGLIERYELYKYDNIGYREKPLASHNASASGNHYVVRKGDTLYSISKKFDTTVEKLQEENNIEGTAIGIGQVLIVNP